MKARVRIWLASLAAAGPLLLVAACAGTPHQRATVTGSERLPSSSAMPNTDAPASAEADHATKATLRVSESPMVPVARPKSGADLFEWSPLERECPPTNPNCTPGANTVGLAWDGATFWASNREGEESGIYRFDEAARAWERQLRWQGGHLGPIAWSDRGLWVVDEERKMIFLVDLISRKPISQIAIPPAALHQPPAITGLTWDGSSVWLVTGCGLCSSYYRLDPTSGDILARFFPRCYPRGLAFDGDFLWTVGYNLPGRPPRLSRRRLDDRNPATVLSSQRLLRFISVGGEPFPQDPTALAVRGDGSLWVVDRATSVIFEVVADRRELPKGSSSSGGWR